MPVGVGDGTDDEPAGGSDQGDRGALQAGRRVEKGTILGELCATTGYHRNLARKALGQGLAPKVVRPCRAAGSQLWGGRRGWTAVLLGGDGSAYG